MTSFSLHEFALLILRVANLTFGGGEPTMAVLLRELVIVRGWLTRERYGLIYSLARATPGTNILAFCAGAGWEVARWKGALVAVLAASVPCAMVVVAFTYGYDLWRSNPLAMSAIAGTLAAAVGMMFAASFQLLRPRWRPGNRVRAAAIALAGFGLSFGLHMPPVQVLGIGALVGLIWRPATEV
jgi:chromate transporter